ncbi:glutamyl-tRNA(Gln) amidotransferase subunit A chloroplastic/mitochondrial-like, partial [Trifolium pratense]
MLSTLQTPRSSLSRFTLPSSSTITTLASLTTQSPTTSEPQSQILSIRHSLLTRNLSAVDLAHSYLTRLRLTEPHLRSFLHLPDDQTIISQANHLDRRIAAGEDVGPLAGVLVAVKDNICTVDMPSTGGSRILQNYRPPFDATAVKKLKELGGIVVGKTNMDEFGMGSTTE